MPSASSSTPSQSTAMYQQLHQAVETLQSLLANHGATTNTTLRDACHQQTTTTTTTTSSSSRTHQYDIRRAIRSIQGLLRRPDFVVVALVVGEDEDDDDDVEGHTIHLQHHEELPPPTTTGTPSSQPPFANDYEELVLRQSQKGAVEDLVALATLDYHYHPQHPQYGEGRSVTSQSAVAAAAATALWNPLLQQVLGVLELQTPPLSSSQLQGLLHRALHLMQEDASHGGVATDGSRGRSHGTKPQELILPLLQVFNQQVTRYEQFQEVLTTDHDLFVALHLAVSYSRQASTMGLGTDPTVAHSSLQLPPLPVAVLIGGLLDYWTLYCLQGCGSSSNHEDTAQEPRANPEPQDLTVWLQYQFLQEHRLCQSPEALRQDVNAFVAQIEDYGTHLMELTLQCLEVAGAGTSPHEVNDRRGGATPSSTGGGAGAGAEFSPQSMGTGSLVRFEGDAVAASSQVTSFVDYDENDQLVTVLQYATVATNFLSAMQSTTLYQGNMAGMSRSLWRELVQFLVQSRLGEDESSSPAGRAEEPAAPAGVDYPRAATDALWRLARLHTYDGNRPTTTTTTSHKEDVPLVVATILRLWKHADRYWTAEAVDWIRKQLHPPLPRGGTTTITTTTTTTTTNVELSRALQVIILSYSTFPSAEYAREPIESLIDLVFGEEQDGFGGTGQPQDPWKEWVRDQLSTSLQEVSSPTAALPPATYTRG